MHSYSAPTVGQASRPASAGRSLVALFARLATRLLGMGIDVIGHLRRLLQRSV